MATPNVGILTNSGKNLIDQVNAGKTKITFSKIVFSSMNNNQLTDDQIKALTTIAPQEIVVNNPKVTLDNNTGETRIRATGNNEALTDGVYVKTYAVYAKDDSGDEILYGITVSPNPNYLPEYDGVTPQAVTYSYKTVIQETSNITMTNSNDVYASQEDLTEAIAAIPQPDLSNYATQQQLATKVDTSAIDPSVLVKNTLTADDDVLALDPGTYWVWKIAPKNYPTSAVPWGCVVVKMLSNGISVDNKLIEVFDTSNHHIFNIYAGNPVAWQGWQVPNDDIMASKSDVTTAISTATANMVDATKATNFPNGLQSGGVDVATAADIKSIEDSAWRPIISNNYSGLCMMKYNADTETMSLSGTIFPKTYSTEGSRVAVIIPMPDGFSMGENTNSKTNIWMDTNGGSAFSGVSVDLYFENDGIHIIFDKVYTDRQIFIILDEFFDPTASGNHGFINFKVTKN